MRRRLTVSILLLIAVTLVVTTIGSYFFIRRAGGLDHPDRAGRPGQGHLDHLLQRRPQPDRPSTGSSRSSPRPGPSPGAGFIRLDPGGTYRGQLPAGITLGELDVPALRAGGPGHRPHPLAAGLLRGAHSASTGLTGSCPSWSSPARSTTRPAACATSCWWGSSPWPWPPWWRRPWPAGSPGPGRGGDHHPAHRLGGPRRHHAGRPTARTPSSPSWPSPSTPWGPTWSGPGTRSASSSCPSPTSCGPP